MKNTLKIGMATLMAVMTFEMAMAAGGSGARRGTIETELKKRITETDRRITERGNNEAQASRDKDAAVNGLLATGASSEKISENGLRSSVEANRSLKFNEADGTERETTMLTTMERLSDIKAELDKQESENSRASADKESVERVRVGKVLAGKLAELFDVMKSRKAGTDDATVQLRKAINKLAVVGVETLAKGDISDINKYIEVLTAVSEGRTSLSTTAEDALSFGMTKVYKEKASAKLDDIIGCKRG